MACAPPIYSGTLGLAQPTISHHMRVLAEAGLVQAEKVGTWVCYCRDDAALRRLAREVRQELEQKPGDPTRS